MSIRTVLGDIDAEELGRTDYHEHLFQVSPLLRGDELVDEQVSLREAGLLAAAGIAAMVDATPIGLGRLPEATARISAATGLAVVATTGCHRSAHYSEAGWVLELDAAGLAARMVGDISSGMPARDDAGADSLARHLGAPIRAGMLKVGIDYWRVDAFARRVLEAVGAAHEATNAPVMVHLEHGSAAFEVLAALADVGVAPSAVVLAHVDRNPDPGLHAELAAAGAYLGYDGPARHREHPDSVVLDCLATSVALGAGDRILLGGDVARSSRYAAAGGMPGLAYLPERFLPRLGALLGTGATERILVDNPRRLLDRFGQQEGDR